MVSLPGHGVKGPPLPSPWGWGHGLVLRRRLLGEEDLRLDILFLRRGILEGLVRRGALSTSPQRGALEPPAVTFFLFQWLSQERVRIRHWEEARLFPKALEHPFLAMEICHALTTLLPRAWWDPGLFGRALRALRALERGRAPGEVRLLFRLGVLEATGHSPWQLLPRQAPPSPSYGKALERVVNELWQDLLESPPGRYGRG